MALSKTQSRRLSVILTVMAKDSVPSNLLQDVLDEGFVAVAYDKSLILTEQGVREKNRLCALAGLSIKYLSEGVL